MKALIFDVDGTLADTEDAHRKAFNDAFVEFKLGWVWDSDLYKKLLKVTGGKQRIRFFLENHDPDFLQRADIDDLILSLHQTKTKYFIARLENGQVPLRPGIEDLIHEARAMGLTIAIATTTTPVNVRTLLTVNLGKDSLDWFACIGDGGVVPVLKPEPDVYNWVLDKLGLRPEEALALEDSRNGLISCVRASVPCLVVTNDYTADQDFSGCLAQWPNYEDVTVAKLEALCATIKL
ncbi:MAG: HAD hydrolase-like protein [Magnetovibrio sp.]|nr:HAD hydrolase-like protein [Magnetovibrio sp.]